MPWVRFDDSCPDNPKIDALGDGAFRLWFNAVCYSNRNLTDGHVPNARISRLTPNYKPAHLRELLDAGAFHKDQDGIAIHDYLGSQPSRAEVMEQREHERQRKARQRANGRNHTTNNPTNGQFVSHRDNQWDNRRESEAESPATQPNPTQPNTVLPLLQNPECAASHEEEEDEATKEARRRLLHTTSNITNPHAWIATTAAHLRAQGWQPTPATPTNSHHNHPTNTCLTCDGTNWIDDPTNPAIVLRCPDCGNG